MKVDCVDELDVMFDFSPSFEFISRLTSEPVFELMSADLLDPNAISKDEFEFVRELCD